MDTETAAAVVAASPMLTGLGVIIAGMLLPLVTAGVKGMLAKLHWNWLAGQGATITALASALVYLVAWWYDGADPALMLAYVKASGAAGMLGVMVHTQAQHAPQARRGG